MLPLLQRGYLNAREIRHFLLRDELGSPVKVPLLTRLNMLRRGFLGQSAVLYDYSNSSLDEYVSDLARVRMSRINHQHNPRAHYPVALDNKLFFTSLMEGIVRVPKICGFVSMGRVQQFHQEAEGLTTATLAEVCAQFGTLVFKPIIGGGGKGIHFLRCVDGQLLLDDSPMSKETFTSWISGLDEYIVCEFIKQGSFSAGLFPHTTNTIRVVTMLDPETNEPFLPIAVHRIGTNKSIPVDNWARGSLSAEVNLETGELSAGAFWPQGKARIVWHERHPDTGDLVKGQRVPGWQDVCEELLAAARRLPFYKIIGWDIVLTDQGIMAVEANGTTGVIMLQIHRPLLRDPRVRAFFEHHRIL